METFLLSALALIVIFLIAMRILRKNTKSFKIKFSFLDGFEFETSFYEELKHNE